MRAPDVDARMPVGGSLSARSLVSVLVLVVVLAAFLGNAHAGPPTPQIAGSVAAPTAADISPICDAPDPSGILGPSSDPPRQSDQHGGHARRVGWTTSPPRRPTSTSTPGAS